MKAPNVRKIGSDSVHDAIVACHFRDKIQPDQLEQTTDPVTCKNCSYNLAKATALAAPVPVDVAAEPAEPAELPGPGGQFDGAIEVVRLQMINPYAVMARAISRLAEVIQRTEGIDADELDKICEEVGLDLIRLPVLLRGER